VTNPVQLPFTVVHGEVPLKSLQHRSQMRLLGPAVQVHVALEPFMGTIHKVPAAVVRGNAHHGEFAFPVPAAHMLEPEKLKVAKFLSECGGALSGEPPK
jgi:hypothetical protein